jgi:hypothetical protein
MIPRLCQDCGNVCFTHAECLKYQDFNLLVDNAKHIAKLRKHIKTTVPHFKGLKKWLTSNVDKEYIWLPLNIAPLGYRFMTLTFDPKKFSFNELTQPQLLINYVRNCLLDLSNLFKAPPVIIIEYHKSGIPHFHLNYECNGVLEHNTLLLRLRYYLSDSLRNKSSVHDRIANEYCKNYMKKSNEQYFTFA